MDCGTCEHCGKKSVKLVEVCAEQTQGFPLMVGMTCAAKLLGKGKVNSAINAAKHCREFSAKLAELLPKMWTAADACEGAMPSAELNGFRSELRFIKGALSTSVFDSVFFAALQKAGRN